MTAELVLHFLTHTHTHSHNSTPEQRNVNTECFVYGSELIFVGYSQTSTMAVSTDLTLKNIREYFLARDNFTVSNFELVKHFKTHLTNPATKGIAL